MNRTKQTPHNLLHNLVACALLVTAPANADDYRDARAELVEAYQQADYAATRVLPPRLMSRRWVPFAEISFSLSPTVIGTGLIETTTFPMDCAVPLY